MLWLLRHAEAAAAIGGGSDDARPLTENGAVQAKSAGRALLRLGVNVDVCLSSPKLRARQTAELACEPLGLEVTLTPELRGAPFDAERLAAGLGDTLMVGHDPSFSQALRDLTGARLTLPKGGLAGVDHGELVLLLGPSELNAISNSWEPAR